MGQVGMLIKNNLKNMKAAFLEKVTHSWTSIDC